MAKQVQPQVERVGLDAWVEHASRLLWQPYGEPTRRWLTQDRRLPEDVVGVHRVGATGITPQDDLAFDIPVEGHWSAAPAAVLPISSRGRAIHAQLRLLDHGDGFRYINFREGTGHRPRLGLYAPPRCPPPDPVTEGILDAVAGNAAGYRAAAILGPGLADANAAVQLSRQNGPLVLALDPAMPGSDVLAQHRGPPVGGQRSTPCPPTSTTPSSQPGTGPRSSHRTSSTL